jgi:hypothetical protein
MLSRTYAHWIAAPANAIDPVKVAIRNQRGYISRGFCGDGVAEALLHHLREAGAAT